MKESSIDDLGKIIHNLALPVVLLVSFLDMKMEMKKSYLLFFGSIFLLCVLLLPIGFAIKKVFRIQYEYFPYLNPGLQYSMLGISLFGRAYGLEKIGFIAITALRHEISIWFVFMPILFNKTRWC